MKPRQHWAPPAPLDGWQDRVGAWVVGVLLLALPAQRQEQELEAVPGERHREQMGLAPHQGPRAPSPGWHRAGCPAQVPSAPSTPASPCPTAWLGGPANVGAGAVGVLVLRGSSPRFPWQPPRAHVPCGDFSRSRWSGEE